MQLPQYTKRVGPQAPMPALPPAQDSAYEGVIRFSEELRRTSNVLGQLAIDNERRVRAQTMQAEQASAWKAWSEAKAAYQETFFAPDTAYVVEEGYDVPNYVRGLQELENFESKFWEETQAGFTYSEAMNNFRQKMEQDHVGFENDLRTAGRDMHLSNLRNILQTTVDDLVDQGDAEGVKDELAAAADNGLISPMEYRDIGNASLRNIAYREVHLSARNMLQGTGDLEAALDDLDQHEGVEWEDMSGETQRLTLRQREELRSNLIQEDNRMRAAKKRREDEADRVGDEEAQRLYMRGNLTLDMLRDEEHPEMAGMYVSTREYWRKILERDDALAAGAGMAQDEAWQRETYANLYNWIEEGEYDQSRMRHLIMQAHVRGDITRAEFNSLNTRNRGRELNNALEDGTEVIESTGRELGLTAHERLEIKNRWHNWMINNGHMYRETDPETGEVTEFMNAGRFDHGEMVQAAYNMVKPAEVERLIQGMKDSSGGRLATGRQQRHAAVETQWKVDDLRFMGVLPDEQAAEALTRMQAQQDNLLGRQIGYDGVYGDHVQQSVVVDPRTGRRHYVLTGPARGRPAVAVEPSYEFTYRVENAEVDDDGGFIRGESVLYVRQGTGWARVRHEDIRKIRERLGIREPEETGFLQGIFQAQPRDMGDIYQGQGIR